MEVERGKGDDGEAVLPWWMKNSQMREDGSRGCSGEAVKLNRAAALSGLVTPQDLEAKIKPDRGGREMLTMPKKRRSKKSKLNKSSQMEDGQGRGGGAVPTKRKYFYELAGLVVPKSVLSHQLKFHISAITLVKAEKTAPEITLKEKALLAVLQPEPVLLDASEPMEDPDQEHILCEKTLLTEPEIQAEKALQAGLELKLEKKEGVKPLQAAAMMALVSLITEPQLPLKPELTLPENVLDETLLQKNVLQMEVVADTKPEPEFSIEEMLFMLEPDPELTMEEKALRGLHIACCHQFTKYDPRKEAWVYTRFCSFNVAFFDLDEESEVMQGPQLHEMSASQWNESPSSSVNVISFKVIESDVRYPINVFGSILARDEVDYKCVYLFRRERDDPQRINSEKDMLVLTGPRRGFSLSGGSLYFEINLKIKGDEMTDDKDFSKGVIEHYEVPGAKGPKTKLLSSWLSTVELVFTVIPHPVAATLRVNILNGLHDAPFNGKITAWTTGNDGNHFILYEYDDSKATGGCELIEDGGSVVLTRNLVAVPLPLTSFGEDQDEELELNVCFTTGDDEDQCTSVTLEYPDEEKVCNHGSYELQVKVAWTAILSSSTNNKEIQRRLRSMPSIRGSMRLGMCQ